MRQQSRKPTRTEKQRRAEPNATVEFDRPPVVKRAGPFEARTEKQKRYHNAMKSFDVVFGIGPAGTGKTYVAGAFATDMLLSNQIDQIIITRPAVEAEESFGALPGELEEKYSPYIEPFIDVLNERMGKGTVQYMIKTGRIVGRPFAFMRGSTFKNCVVILDEAQNATAKQMKLFLTRVGENCKVIIDGDSTQCDIRNSGLMDAVSRLSFIPTVKVIQFNRDEVVRSGFVAEVLQAYEEPLQESAA